MDAALNQTIDRLEAVLVYETEALKAGGPVDLADSTDRKNKSLLELMRMSRGLNDNAVGPDTRARLADVRHLVEINRRMLELHVRASREVSDLIARSIENAESDGTYSRLTPSRQRRP